MSTRFCILHSFVHFSPILELLINIHSARESLLWRHQFVISASPTLWLCDFTDIPFINASECGMSLSHLPCQLLTAKELLRAHCYWFCCVLCMFRVTVSKPLFKSSFAAVRLKSNLHMWMLLLFWFSRDNQNKRSMWRFDFKVECYTKIFVKVSFLKHDFVVQRRMHALNYFYTNHARIQKIVPGGGGGPAVIWVCRGEGVGTEAYFGNFIM